MVARLERRLPRRDLSIYGWPRCFVASIDFVKSQQQRDRLLRHLPDLVIVDEAHTAARPRGDRGRAQQQRHELLRVIAQDAGKHLILVTATPHSGIEESFRSLLGLLNPGFERLGIDPQADRKRLLPHIVQRRRRDVERWMGAETPFPEPPVHIVAFDRALDERGKDRQRSPHALVQEFLNRDDSLWGLVTNGRKLRLLRNTQRFTKPTYVEFDLEAIIEGNLYSEFLLVYRVLHRTRLPEGAGGAHECLLERWYQQGIEEGGRVRERLRDGVEAALKAFGTGFLAHPDSDELRAAVERGTLPALDLYRELLRLVYRLLFLMVAEERKLLFLDDLEKRERQEIYTRWYSIERLRARAETRHGDDPYPDLWQGLVQTFRLFREERHAQKLGLGVLDGELFGGLACRFLERAQIRNDVLLDAIFQLSTFEETVGRKRGGRRRVAFSHLDVEELGSVYESLLDFHPDVSLAPARFDLLSGTERKATGSYYTPKELVAELIKSALEPVMEERLAAAKTPVDKERALLDLRVCDPAAGSGHFLLAAARRLGRELARVRTGEAEPPPSHYRRAVRDVVRHCLYAVDRNPLAVDLCKVSLWIEGHDPGLPLSFLDHHIRLGDSLVGIFDTKVLEKGVPDAAYKVLTGDDGDVARDLRRRNQKEREGQQSLDLFDAPT